MFVRVVGAEGLPSGSLTSPIVLRSDLGYTGEEPRLEMFENRALRGRRGVSCLSSTAGAQLVKISEFPIERQLLTH